MHYHLEPSSVGDGIARHGRGACPAGIRDSVTVGAALGLDAAPTNTGIGDARVVTRLDEDADLFECPAEGLLGVDLTRGNIERVLALLNRREDLWHEAVAAPPTGDPSDYSLWSLTGVIYQLPQGWLPASMALVALTPAERRVWSVEREFLPIVARMRDAWDAVARILDRTHRRGHSEEAEVQEVVSLLRDVIESKWRLGHAAQCEEEFRTIGEVLLPSDATAAGEHLRLGAACARRRGTVASSAWPGEGSGIGGSNAGSRDAVDEAGPGGQGRARKGGKAGPCVEDDRDGDWDTFRIGREAGGSFPIGPFEPFESGGPQTGMQQLMDPSHQGSLHASYLFWTRVAGVWTARIYVDKFGRHMWKARNCLAMVARARNPMDAADESIVHTVRALEAFFNQVSYFTANGQDQAWPSTSTLGMLGDPEGFKRIPGLVKKIKRLGDRTIGAGWLAEDVHRDLKQLSELRNELIHPAFDKGRTLSTAFPRPRNEDGGRVSKSDAWKMSAWKDRPLDMDLAADAFQCVLKTISIFRSAYADKHPLPIACALELPDDAPRPEILVLGYDADGPTLISGFPIRCPRNERDPDQCVAGASGLETIIACDAIR